VPGVIARAEDHPPLCLDTDGVGFFANALERALREGW
jgi:hypothetical protein